MLLFISCGSEESVENRVNITINSEDIVVQPINNRESINMNFHNASKKAYILFTNRGEEEVTLNIVQKIGSQKEGAQEKLETTLSSLEEPFLHASKSISDFNHLPVKKVLKRGEMFKEERDFKESREGDRELFYLDKSLNYFTDATLKKRVKVTTENGDKTLNIWVSDDTFGAGCSKSYCVQQKMIDLLATKFLKEGADNDIYDWVTNIFGEEWGKTDNTLLIDERDEITILLTDIDGDDRTSGVVLGYFYAKDNYKKRLYDGSNERTMFYIDSVAFAYHQTDALWSMEGAKQKKILSTLAHEFEHMIQFYQKNVLYGDGNLKPWIDEMLAVTVEDIIATKLETDGLRGVSYTRGDAGDTQNRYGKFPLFNKNINLSLPVWHNRREDYSKVAAFGAYLIRNYGGAELLHDILHNEYRDEKAITHAVEKASNGAGKSFDRLIHDWGIAVLLSSSTTVDMESGYLYNLGDFLTSEYGESVYKMGSINFFNYSSRPHISKDVRTIAPNSNLYYSVGENLTGDVNITIEPNLDILSTLIIK